LAGRRERLVLRVAEERRPCGAVPSPEAALLDSEQREELLAPLADLSSTDRETIAWVLARRAAGSMRGPPGAG
jgi:hypothetical protein